MDGVMAVDRADAAVFLAIGVLVGLREWAIIRGRQPAPAATRATIPALIAQPALAPWVALDDVSAVS